MLRQHKLNAHVVFAEGSSNFMQGLPRLPATPHLLPLLLRKLEPPLKSHKHHLIEKAIYTRWCCIDRLNRQGFSETGNCALSVRYLSEKPTHSAG